MAGHRQGLYPPKNVEKYVGNINKVRFMSSWELNFMVFLDNNPNILRWSSEEIAIPYIKPTDGRVHKYYPDFWVEFNNKDGELVREIIEIKPDSQTRPPKRVGKRKPRQLKEQIMYAVNVAKWEACQQFCNKYGLKFRLVTEKHLFK